MLIAIKLLHTAIWAFLAGSILVLPAIALLRKFRWAAIVTAIILLECGVLAINGGRCPLTVLAARYTIARAPNFDIYLPSWLAEHNKVIFGGLFVTGEFLVIGSWLKRKFIASDSEAIDHTGARFSRLRTGYRKTARFHP